MWAPKCESHAFFIEMTEPRKKLFLTGHNRRRNVLAKGELPGAFARRIAVDMAEMVIIIYFR